MKEKLDLRIYDTSDVAQTLGVSERQARNVCNAVFRSKPRNTHIRLTESQLKIIHNWHKKIKKKRAF